MEEFSLTAAAQLGSSQLLQHVFTEQCDREPGASAQVWIKRPSEIPSDSVQNPADPEASYTTHRGCGYGGHVMDTCAEDDEAAGQDPTEPPVPDGMTHVAVHKLPHHDVHAIPSARAAVQGRGCCPTRLLGDRHSGSRETVAA